MEVVFNSDFIVSAQDIEDGTRWNESEIIPVENIGSNMARRREGHINLKDSIRVGIEIFIGGLPRQRDPIFRLIQRLLNGEPDSGKWEVSVSSIPIFSKGHGKTVNFLCLACDPFKIEWVLKLLRHVFAHEKEALTPQPRTSVLEPLTIEVK